MEPTVTTSSNAFGESFNVSGRKPTLVRPHGWDLLRGKLHGKISNAERFKRLKLHPGDDYSEKSVEFKYKLPLAPIRTTKRRKSSKIIKDQVHNIAEPCDGKAPYVPQTQHVDVSFTEEKELTPCPSPQPPTPPKTPPEPSPSPPPPPPPPPPPKSPSPVPEEEDEGNVSLIDFPSQEEMIPIPSPIQPTSPKKMPLPPASPVWVEPEEASLEKTGETIHDESPWKRILVGFTQDTTLHGLRFTTTSSQFKSRKWLWTIVLLVSFAVFVFYVSDRLSEFLQYRKNVNVQVNYISHVYFPSVTICNENAFRLSAAANGRWYNQVERILESSQVTVGEPCDHGQFTCDDFSCIVESARCDSFPDCINAEDELGCNTTMVAVEESRLLLGQNATDNTINLEAMFNDGAHDLGDLIMNCLWKGQPCNATDLFDKTFTDMGVCYRFAKPDAKITQSGPGYGLSLAINIEQYDYTKNPETGVGIKVLLNTHWDVPMMGEKAFAISPGLYSLVAIEKTNVENLEPPWGVCSEIPLTYYKNYSVSACYLDCENRYVRAQCQCRDLHMPPASDNVDVCQVGAYMNCTRPKLEEMRAKGNYCTCPTPCTDTNLVPSLSFSAISVDSDAGGVAQQKRVEDLTTKLAQAREIRYRLAKNKYRQTLRVFFDIDKALGHISNYINQKSSTFYSEKEWLMTIKILMQKDCVQFTSKQNNIIQNIKRESLTAVNRYIEYLFNFLLVPTETLKRVIIDAGLVFGNESTSIEDRIPYTTTINTKLNDIISYIDIGIMEGLVRLKEGVNSTAYMFDEYGYTTELLTPLLSTSRVKCSWCLTNGVHKPLMELLATNLFDTIDNTILPLMEDMKSQAALLYQYGNRTVLFNETIDCEVTTVAPTDFTTDATPTDFTTDDTSTVFTTDDTQTDFTTDETSTDFTTDATYTTEAPVTCYITKVLGEWDIMLNIAKELETNITSLVSNMTTMQQVVIDAWGMVEELQRHISPKCESELSKLFDEYNDIYVKLSNTLTQTNQRYQNLRSNLSTYENEYIKLNLSLSEISTLARFEFQKTFISSQTVSLGSLLDSRSASLSSLRRQINAINYHILSQVTLEHLINSFSVWSYFGVNDTSEVQPADSVCDEGGCYVEPALVARAWASPLVSLNKEVASEQNALLQAVIDLEAYLNTYMAGNVIDDAFYKKNFLQLDLFFKELTEKSVVQQKAYEYSALLSELGGLLGLLLGASVLTVVEVLDMIIYNGIIKCVVSHKEKKMQENVTLSNGTAEQKKDHVVSIKKV